MAVSRLHDPLIVSRERLFFRPRRVSGRPCANDEAHRLPGVMRSRESEDGSRSVALSARGLTVASACPKTTGAFDLSHLNTCAAAAGATREDPSQFGLIGRDYATLAAITELTAICFSSRMVHRQIRFTGLGPRWQPSASQAEGREFEPRLPLQIRFLISTAASFTEADGHS